MSLLEMRPFELTITRDAGPTDTRQVPAAGATVVGFEGATVKTAATVLDHSTAVVQVTNTGRLQVGSYVIQNYDESPALVVTSVSVTGVAVTLANEDTGVNVELAVGDRLVVVTPTPLLYDDANGEMAVGSNVVTLDGRGYRRFYCPETRFDYVVEGGGVGKRLLFLDGVGGWERGGTAWINARDYPSIQEAVNALTARGGIVYIPAGNYNSLTRPTYTQTLMLPENIPSTVDG